MKWRVPCWSPPVREAHKLRCWQTQRAKIIHRKTDSYLSLSFRNVPFLHLTHDHLRQTTSCNSSRYPPPPPSAAFSQEKCEQSESDVSGRHVSEVSISQRSLCHCRHISQGLGSAVARSSKWSVCLSEGLRHSREFTHCWRGTDTSSPGLPQTISHQCTWPVQPWLDRLLAEKTKYENHVIKSISRLAVWTG